jgi:multidrug efflux pump subunit AcrA (membrane-fusion protein)
MNVQGCVLSFVLLSVLSVGVGGCAQQPPLSPSFPPLVVTISQPIERQVIDHDEYTGRTTAVEEVEIRTRVSGYLVKVNFTEGAEVPKGELLFQIDPRPFQATLDAAKGQVAQWEAKRARAEADVARNQRLLPKGAASQKDLDNSTADLGEARAAIQSAQAVIQQATLSLEFTRITAPISGRISRTSITEGNLVTADSTLLTTIVSMHPMYAYFDVDERSMLRYQQLTRERKRQSAREARVPVLLKLKPARKWVGGSRAPKHSASFGGYGYQPHPSSPDALLKIVEQAKEYYVELPPQHQCGRPRTFSGQACLLLAVGGWCSGRQTSGAVYALDQRSPLAAGAGLCPRPASADH